MPRPRLIRETLLLDDEVHGDLQEFGRRAVEGAESITGRSAAMRAFSDWPLTTLM